MFQIKRIKKQKIGIDADKVLMLFMILTTATILLRFSVSFLPGTTFNQDPFSPFIALVGVVLLALLFFTAKTRIISHVYILSIVALSFYYYWNYTLYPIAPFWAIVVILASFFLFSRTEALLYSFIIFLFGISQFFLARIVRGDWYIFISSLIISGFIILAFYFYKRFEAEGQLALQRLASIVENSRDAIFSLSLEGDVLSWNRGAEELFGYEKDEMIGGSLQKIIPDDFQDEFKESLKKVRRGEDVKHLRTKRKTRDGVKLDVLLSVSVIRDRYEHVEGASVILRDITEEVMIDKAKTEFVSLASHQLRSPLTASKWNTELLLNSDLGSLNKEQRDAVMQISEINKKMDVLVKALLNVSRIEIGRFAVDPVEVDIRDLIEAEISEIVHRAREKDMSIIKEFGKDVPETLSLDPQLIKICIQNYLTNAIKYNKKGGQVHVRLLKHDDRFRFEVEDTGIGIHPRDKQRIFTKLYRADNAMKLGKDGNGLGLYIVKSIIEQSGGEVGFSSQVDVGTIFYLELPMEGMKKIEGARPLE